MDKAVQIQHRGFPDNHGVINSSASRNDDMGKTNDTIIYFYSDESGQMSQKDHAVSEPSVPRSLLPSEQNRIGSSSYRSNKSHQNASFPTVFPGKCHPENKSSVSSSCMTLNLGKKSAKCGVLQCPECTLKNKYLSYKMASRNQLQVDSCEERGPEIQKHGDRQQCVDPMERTSMDKGNQFRQVDRRQIEKYPRNERGDKVSCSKHDIGQRNSDVQQRSNARYQNEDRYFRTVCKENIPGDQFSVELLVEKRNVSDNDKTENAFSYQCQRNAFKEKTQISTKAKTSGHHHRRSNSNDKVSECHHHRSTNKEEPSGHHRHRSTNKEETFGHHHHRSTAKEEPSGHHHHRSTTKEEPSGHHHHRSTNKEEPSGHHHHRSATKEEPSGHHHHRSTTKEEPSGHHHHRSASKEKTCGHHYHMIRKEENKYEYHQHRSSSKEKTSGHHQYRSSSKEKQPGHHQHRSSSKEKISGHHQHRNSSKEKISGHHQHRSSSKEKISGHHQHRSSSKEKQPGRHHHKRVYKENNEKDLWSMNMEQMFAFIPRAVYLENVTMNVPGETRILDQCSNNVYSESRLLDECKNDVYRVNSSEKERVRKVAWEESQQETGSGGIFTISYKQDSHREEKTAQPENKGALSGTPSKSVSLNDVKICKKSQTLPMPGIARRSSRSARVFFFTPNDAQCYKDARSVEFFTPKYSPKHRSPEENEDEDEEEEEEEEEEDGDDDDDDTEGDDDDDYDDDDCDDADIDDDDADDNDHKQYKAGSETFAALRNIPSSLSRVEIPLLKDKNIRYCRKENGSIISIGQGVYGGVYLAELKGHPKKVVIKDFESSVSTSDQLIIKEAKILRYLQSTGVVPKLFGLTRASRKQLALVQEYFGHGVTLGKLISGIQDLSHRSWICIMFQMAVGMNHIHSKGVVHNDIQTGNILIDIKHPMYKTKFIDFGLATFRCGHRFGSNKEYLQQFEHLAPEVQNGSYTTFKSDVFSLGWVLGTIAQTTEMEIDSIWEIIEEMTKDQPEQRPSANNLEEMLKSVLKMINEKT